MVVELTGTQCIHHLAGIAQGVSHADLQLKAVEVDSSLLDALETAHFVELEVRQGLARVYLINGTQCCLHHTTSDAEDGTSTGRFAKRRVEVAVRQVDEVDIGTLDQAAQLTGRDAVVHIGISIHLELFTTSLILLSQAGHDGNNHEFFAGDTHLLCPVSLGDSAEHLGDLADEG